MATAQKPGEVPSRPSFRRRKQLEKDLEHITQEMYKRNKELIDTNKTLSLLKNIDSLVLESQGSLAEVCTQVATVITEATDYPFVGIFTRINHPRKTVSNLLLTGWNTKSQQNLELEKPIIINLNNKWFSSSAATKTISLETTTTKQMAEVLNYSHTQLESLQARLTLKTLYVIKLISRQRLVGLIVVGFEKSAKQIDETDTVTINRLSESIGVALDNKLLFEENRQVLHQLRESNIKLKELDETKDDFISMASHQLRTPLTSVKGYVSMVMEGDAGKLNATQKKLLEQAFISSQRMVFLIADLLNVSRLKTGKFVIDSAPVNLAELIQQEVDQLIETAASRDLTLTYTKPTSFPSILLDETKTRQVVMNFIDNAIYYTPAGGHIAVELAETPASVELRVVDNGIGVPKGEQHHLFTKFYRAGNARQARPDGTGLGLFMAKKVIVAQGGAIIFETQEGKGSTFGFVFSKTKLAPKAGAAPVAKLVPTKPLTSIAKQ